MFGCPFRVPAPVVSTSVDVAREAMLLLGTPDQCLLVVEQRVVHQEAVGVTKARLCTSSDSIFSLLLRQYHQRMSPVAPTTAGAVASKFASGVSDAPLRSLLLVTLAQVVGWAAAKTPLSADSVASLLAVDIASIKSGANLPGVAWGWSPETLSRVLVDIACCAPTMNTSRTDRDALVTGLVTFSVMALSCLVDLGDEVGTRCLRHMLGCGFLSTILKVMKTVGPWLASIVRPQLVQEVRCVIQLACWQCWGGPWSPNMGPNELVMGRRDLPLMVYDRWLRALQVMRATFRP